MAPTPAVTKPLKWVRGFLGDPAPEWTKDPDLDLVHTVMLKHIPSPDTLDSESLAIKPSFFAAGAFNKLYALSLPTRPTYLLRVTLPLEPYYKVESEVATLRFVTAHTKIPVPRLLAWDSSTENELGFEWILTEKIEGVGADECWSKMSMQAKEEFTREVAGYIKELWSASLDVGFDRIGNLYLDGAEHEKDDRNPNQLLQASNPDKQWSVGRIVTIWAEMGERVALEFDHGPYATSAAYVASRLQAQIKELDFWSGDAKPVRSGAEYEDDYAEDMDELGPPAAEAFQTLLGHIGSIFEQEGASGPAACVLHHDDVKGNNILVDPATHRIVGILDWENVSILPFWEALEYPKFLMGRYRPDGVDMSEFTEDDPCQKDWLEDFEKKGLRKIFDEVLIRSALVHQLCGKHPNWFPLVQGFYEEVENMENFTFGPPGIEGWVKKHDEYGEIPGLDIDGIMPWIRWIPREKYLESPEVGETPPLKEIDVDRDEVEPETIPLLTDSPKQPKSEDGQVAICPSHAVAKWSWQGLWAAFWGKIFSFENLLFPFRWWRR